MFDDLLETKGAAFVILAPVLLGVFCLVVGIANDSIVILCIGGAAILAAPFVAKAFINSIDD